MENNYKKLYKETIEKLRKLYIDWCSTQNRAAKEIEESFPELRESKDEKIRKSLITLIKEIKLQPLKRLEDWDGYIAWLEKQGEQKPADKVEPKFKVGDWCIDNEDGTIFQITKVLDNTYTYKTNEGEEYSCTHYSLENDARLWNIQDAKDCDVLASKRSIFIFGQEYMAGKPEAHCGIMNGLLIVKPEGCWTNEKCYPATKEQYNILFQKIEEAGYEWDTEKKELKKIEIEQKPAEWSEEDELILNDFISSLKYNHENAYNKQISWLKSLKDRILPQPKREWSEEDEKIINDAIWLIEHYATDGNKKLLREQTIDKLKSLKPQNHWKPSEEQMKALNWIAYNYALMDKGTEEKLQSLYNAIKSF